MNNNFKLKELEAENFKGVDNFKRADINGRSFVVIGPNESGKSTVIDMVMSPADKDVLPPEPIKKGEERAKIRQKIYGTLDGVEREFTIELSFTKSQKKGKLMVFDEKGEKITPPGDFLDGLLGSFSFEIEDFLKGTTQKDHERRQKDLYEISGRAKELYKLDADKKVKIAERETMGQEVRNLEANVYSHGITNEEFELYMDPPKVAPEVIEQELNDVQPAIDKINKNKEALSKLLSDTAVLEMQLQKSDETIKNTEELIKSLEEQIKTAKAKISLEIASKENIEANITTNKSRIQKGQEWISKTVAPDISEISNRLKAANTHKQVHEKILEFQKKQQDLFSKKKDYEAIQSAIAGIITKKGEIIADSKLPVRGLTIDETGIYLDGLPFEKGQINTARMLEVGEEIAMAKNPGLKVIFVRDGSLYDTSNLKRLVQKAESRGYQVIIEIVGDNSELEIKWTEDYFKSKEK